MHWISLPTSACSSRQHWVSAFSFARSKSRFKRNVPSLPRLSKSSKRTTAPTPRFSISTVASRKDLPPVFTVTTLPRTPNSWRAWASFLPSTTIGLPFAASSASLATSCSSFSSLSLSLVDNGFYLVILACRTVSRQSMASLLFAKYRRTGSNTSASSAATPPFRSIGCSLPSA